MAAVQVILAFVQIQAQHEGVILEINPDTIFPDAFILEVLATS